MAGQPATVNGDLQVAVSSPRSGTVVLSLVGDVDMLTAPSLAEHVRSQLGSGQVRSLVFDLSGVTFLGSAGLAVLAEANTAATDTTATVRVVASSRMVLRPLQVTGLDQVLTIVPDVDSAIGTG
jgi:anti-anti-sigma factor